MKKKVEKGKVDNATKKTRRSVEKELVSGEEDAEETIEAKETEEEELEMMPGIKAVAGIKSNNRQSENLVGKELVDFQNNFNLVTSTSPGTKSQLLIMNATPFCFHRARLADQATQSRKSFSSHRIYQGEKALYSTSIKLKDRLSSSINYNIDHEGDKAT